MTPGSRHARRGLTLIELMLALSLTTMVGLAITGMLTAVTSGVSTHKDARSVMIRSATAQTRLAAYVSPSRSVLSSDGSELALWFGDFRKGDAVHASEIRWIRFDAASGMLTIEFVRFPDAWSQAAKDLQDLVYLPGTDWQAVRVTYAASGWIETLPLVDQLDAVAIRLDNADPALARQVLFDLSFATEAEPVEMMIAAALRRREPPA